METLTPPLTAKNIDNILMYKYLTPREEQLEAFMFNNFMQYEFKDNSIDTCKKQFYKYLEDLKDFLTKYES